MHKISLPLLSLLFFNSSCAMQKDERFDTRLAIKNAKQYIQLQQKNMNYEKIKRAFFFKLAKKDCDTSLAKFLSSVDQNVLPLLLHDPLCLSTVEIHDSNRYTKDFFTRLYKIKQYLDPLSPLGLALFTDNNSFINTLLHYGTDINYTHTANQPTVLEIATRYQPKYIPLLIKKNVIIDPKRSSIFIPCSNELTKTNFPFIADEAQRNILALEKLIEAGISCTHYNEFGLTPLHLACINDKYDAAVTLLNHGAPVNIPDADGLTPVQLAFMARRENILALLLWHNPTAKTADQNGPDNEALNNK